MVFEKMAAMPHIPRSARGKRSSRKKESPMSAFDILATVAGEMASGGEESPFLVSINNASSSSSALKACRVKQERFDEAGLLKNEVIDQNSCNEGSALVKKDVAGPSFAAGPDPVSALAKPDSEKELSVKLGERSQMTSADIGNCSPGVYSLMDAMDLDVKPPPPLVSSDSSSEMPACRSSSCPRDRNRGFFEQGDDDDDNSSGCTYPTAATSRKFTSHFVSDRRRVKKMASKFRKVSKGDLSDCDVKRKTGLSYTRQRTIQKRQKMLERSVVTSDNGFFRRRVLSSNEKGGAKGKIRDDRPSTSMASPKQPFELEDCQVKLSIKSFKVPELLIEIPENATVASLKRSVMEAVNKILGSGLHIGVLLHGRKMKDDSKTLVQAGITHGDELDSLGFSLEPGCADQHKALVLQQPPTGDARDGSSGSIAHSAARAPPAVEIPLKEEAANAVEMRPQLALARLNPPQPLSRAPSEDLRAIVPFVPVKTEPVAAAAARKAAGRKPVQGQRRIRRPFSVSEVEALVQAVEMLGTGRWRDVKLQAFDKAKHRTYVDLKDKWKTLVHTASISPQQRRGEPVPQVLLDRVLAAQAHWSHQQAKIQRQCYSLCSAATTPPPHPHPPPHP